MNTADFQNLCSIRIKEAKILLDSRCYDGAYYLASYAVECALKACIAKKTRRYEFPDWKLAEKSWTHDLGRLLDAEGLQKECQKQLDADGEFALRWTLVTDWSEQSRHQTTDRLKAQIIYDAIVNRKHGVLKWLKTFW